MRRAFTYLPVLILGLQYASVFGQDSFPEVTVDSVLVKDFRIVLEQAGSARYALPENPAVPAGTGNQLALHSPVALRAYGPSMLQSVSSRGTGADHLALLWNGINLQSITHGQVDFSLMEFDGPVSFVPGGNSPMDGSGSIGGTVRLNSRFQSPEGVHFGISSTLASFHNRRFAANTSFKNGPLISKLSARYHYGKNDFPFVNTASVSRPVQRQVNSEVKILQLNFDNQLIINKKNLVRFFYWHTKALRQIPPPMTAANDHSVQEDAAHRFLGIWIHDTGKGATVKTSFAHINEQLTFANDGLHSFTATSSQVLDSRWSRKFSRFRILGGLHSALETAYSDGYGGRHRRLTSAIVGGGTWQPGPRSLLAVQARAEFSQGSPRPLVYSVAWERNLIEREKLRLKWRAKAGRHFHAPTFNDLFWKGLGNPDLKSEQGWQMETGGDWAFKSGAFSGSLSATFFWMKINDRIIWAPDNAGIWRPENRQQVRSYGTETRWTTAWQKRKTAVELTLIHGFTDAINSKSDNTPDWVGKHLIYIPRHKFSGLLTLRRNQFRIQFTENYTSRRPVSSDNNTSLPSYSTEDIFADYLWNAGKTRFTLSASVQNLRNVNYQMIAFRPMPGRTWSVGLRVAY